MISQIEGSGSPPRHEFQNRQAQAFLENLDGTQRIAPGHDASHIGMMRDGGGITHQRALEVDRLDDVHVGQMLARTFVRVVEDEDVARRGVVAILGAQCLHRIIEAAEMHGRRQALRERTSLSIAHRRRVVHRIADDAGMRRAHQDQRYLIGDRVERVLVDFEEEGIGLVLANVVHRIVLYGWSPTSIIRLPEPSSPTEQPGGTTAVESYSSTMSGPGAGVSDNAARAMTAVVQVPMSGPK